LFPTSFFLRVSFFEDDRQKILGQTRKKSCPRDWSLLVSEPTPKTTRENHETVVLRGLRGPTCREALVSQIAVYLIYCIFYSLGFGVLAENLHRK